MKNDCFYIKCAGVITDPFSRMLQSVILRQKKRSEEQNDNKYVDMSFKAEIWLLQTFKNFFLRSLTTKLVYFSKPAHWRDWTIY